MRLSGKKALVTGAASGIGRAIASRFIEEGADVACIDINSSELNITVTKLQNHQRKLIGIVADVSIPSDVENAAQKAITKLGGLDIVVNNAGANQIGTIDTFSHEQWNKTIALNLTSFFSMSKYIWPHFVRQGHGVILNTSSIMGITGASKNFAYCTCKACPNQITRIIALTKSLAADGGPLGIRVKISVFCRLAGVSKRFSGVSFGGLCLSWICSHAHHGQGPLERKSIKDYKPIACQANGNSKGSS